MKISRLISMASGTALVFSMVAFSGAAVLAQDATPEAVEASPPRPVHIHTGNCDELGEVVVPLTDLTAPTGDRVGQRNRATVAETSFTSVPLTLDAILAADHAINAHLSADEIETYIACGELGGVIGPDGTLVVGLHPQSDSDFYGIAFLSPGADGASTDVSVFVAESGREGRGGGQDQAQDAAADTDTDTGMDTDAMATPAP
jgi:hypothetical protein